MAAFNNWATLLLQRMGMPVTKQNLQYLAAWQAHEGGSAANNPLNTTQPADGATSYNSVGVRNYTSPAEGLMATIKTLRNGHYPAILQALKSGNPTWNETLGQNLNTWGTGSSFMKGYRQTSIPGTPPPAGQSLTPKSIVDMQSQIGGPDSMKQLVAMSLMQAATNGGQFDPMSIFGLAMQRQQMGAAQDTFGPLAGPQKASQSVTGASSPTPPTTKGMIGGLAEAFYDPLGSWDNGRFGGAIGHHSDHVHLSITNPQSMLAAIRQAQSMGLRVGENPYVDPVDPVHVKGSFHYRDFPGVFNKKKLGEAIDVSGNPNLMAAYYRWATGKR